MKNKEFSSTLKITFIFIIISLFTLQHFPIISSVEISSNDDFNIILLTGFEGWNIHDFNPSGAIAQSLNGSMINETKIVGVVLPVDFEKAFSILNDLLEIHQPGLIICTGLAPNANTIRIETYAYNIYFDSYSSQPFRDMRRIDLEESMIKPASIKVRETTELLEQSQFQVEQSYFPGLYLCNAIFYQAVNQAQKLELNSPVGFIHIPQVKPYDPDGFDISILQDAIHLAISNNI